MAIPPGHDVQSLELLRRVLGHAVKSPLLVLYVGPDQIMPITSVLGAAVGIVLMFFNRIVLFVSRLWNAVRRTPRASQTDSPE